MRTRSLAGLAAGIAVCCVAAASVAVANPEAITHSADDASLSLSVLGNYSSGSFDVSAAEIVAFHAGSQRTFVVNAESGVIDVLDSSDPTHPTYEASIDAEGIAIDGGGSIGAGTTANSVAVRADGLAVAAIEAPTKTDPGWLISFDANTLQVLGAVEVGALPDMVGLTPGGSRAVTANEGEPADDFSIDPVGSVSIIDLPGTVAAPTQSDVRFAGFEEFEEGGSKTLDPAIRIFGPNPHGDLPVSRNLEPEYVAISPDGSTGYAALQEANAVAVIDLDNAEVTDIWPLTPIDHSQPGNGLDVSDRDGAINIDNWPILGLQMPDGIYAYDAGGQTYLVTINEGDAREWGDYVEPSRIAGLGQGGLAPICETNPAFGLTAPEQLGRLNVTTASGLSDDGSCYEQLYSFGSRSISIWTTTGELVYDSGDGIEQVIAEALPEYFNSNHSESNFEGRSDDKGPEPENAVIGTVGERTYVFVGLERVGGVIVFDITDPADTQYVTYINRRDFGVSGEDDIEGAQDPAAVLESAGDLGPEGLFFVPASESPTGEPIVIVGSEVSGTVTFFGVTDLLAPPPTEPAPTTPTPTVPAPTEPAPSEPNPSEPAPSEPAPTEPSPSVSAGVDDGTDRGWLPATGADTMAWLLGLGVALAAAGAGALWFSQRRGKLR